jgi:hypothetical protein
MPGHVYGEVRMNFMLMVVAVLFVLWAIMSISANDNLPGFVGLSERSPPNLTAYKYHNFSVNDTLDSNITGG